MLSRSNICGLFLSGLVAAIPASASEIFTFSSIDFPGLAAEAEFDLLTPTTLEVRLRNTSTGAPAGFDGAAQLLTGVSWDFDPFGPTGNTAIVGGTAVIGPTSQTINFDTGTYGPGTNIGGEWGYSNVDGTGALWNFISGNAASATPFGGPNLDGPGSQDGPQAGLAANPPVADLGGLGAIQDEIIATLTLSNPLPHLDFLAANGTRVEFGSDAAFMVGQRVPEPGSMLLTLVGGCLVARRRR